MARPNIGIHKIIVGFFEVAKFPNDASNGDSKNGTYYTSVECEDKGGTKDGNCANGFDVCRVSITYYFSVTAPSRSGTPVIDVVNTS